MRNTGVERSSESKKNMEERGLSKWLESTERERKGVERRWQRDATNDPYRNSLSQG